MRFFLSFILLSCAFVSCSDKAARFPKNQKICLNLYCEPPTLDSRKAVDATSMNVLLMLFEGLTRLDKNHQPKPAIAKEILISENQKIYTFLLRDCHWSNGDPVTADDFLYAWKKILDPKFPADYAQKLYIIKNAQKYKEGTITEDQLGLKLIDKLSFQVELEHPAPYFLELTSFPTFYPIHSQTDMKKPEWAMDAGADFINNGPFQLFSWEHENQLILRKNPFYWDQSSVKLEEIDLVMVNDTSTELLMYENNELDWAGSPLSNLPSEAIPIFKKQELLKSYPVGAVYYYVFNTEQFPFNNVKIRQAFSLVINRQEIIDHILQADQIPATGLIPPLALKKELSTPSYFKDADRKKALELFEEGIKELQISRE